MRWWRERGAAARLDLYLRVSCYLNYAAAPLLLAFFIAPEVGSSAAFAVGALTGGFAYLCVLLLRAGIEYHLGRGDQPVSLIALTAALAVTAAGLSGHLPSGATIAMFAVAMYVTALATAVRGSTAVLVWAVVAVVASITVTDEAPVYVPLLAALMFAYRLSVWMLDLFWQLDHARLLERRFAVAEERLRFARDLHDVVGRNLSVVVLKAELAAQLAKRDRPEAVDEMLEIRRIGQESLAELRAVVSGYRTADLGAELAGARSLLQSAGISCRVVGSAEDLPAAVQTAFGWAVREGTTNILRHSEAHACTITLRPVEGVIALVMDNDGVSVAGPVRPGNGLVGLSERIVEYGGRVAATRTPPDGFRLTVTLPPPAGDL